MVKTVLVIVVDQIEIIPEIDIIVGAAAVIETETDTIITIVIDPCQDKDQEIAAESKKRPLWWRWW